MLMFVTVILCTYNRAPSLRRALESLSNQSLSPNISWEVVVIDNNSRDDTSEVVREFCQRFPGRFKYVFEPRQGKSFALNRGIHESAADVVAFVDDDVEVDPNWLSCLTSALQTGQWAGVGGRILPEKGFISPPWLDLSGRYALAPLAVFDLGPEAHELEEPPFGTNMAFRMSMFTKYGGFRTDLGPQPGSEIRGEDTEFGQRLIINGERFWYEASAIVYHSVSRQRLTKKYFLTWWHDKARADIREHGLPGNPALRLGGIPLVLFRRLCMAGLRWLSCFGGSRRFSLKLKFWGIMGAIKECYGHGTATAAAKKSDYVHIEGNP
jgi:glycosyltransferase involved in cell wall biosynthesis